MKSEEIEQEISQPSAYYDRPEDVLSDTSLNRSQKMKALENWRLNCLQLQQSTEEGMAAQKNEEGLQAENLRLVTKAIERLRN